MNRNAFLLLLLVLGLFCAGPSFAETSGKVIVLPFAVNAGPDLAYLEESLPKMLRERLTDMGFDVVPEGETMRLLEEQRIEYLDLNVAKDMALLAGAGHAVYGSFSQVGESISLDTRLVEAYGVTEPKPFFVVKEGVINILPAIDETAAKIKLGMQQKDRIASIDVRGNEILDDDVVLMRLKIQPGDTYDPKAVNAELKSLYDLGYFDDIEISMDDSSEGKRLIITVKEKPLIQAISVQGAQELDADDLLAAIATKTGAVLNPRVLADDMGKIRELYRKDGYYNAKVSYSLEQADAKRARLNILVDEGKKLYVTDIIIQGAKQLDPDDLKDELALSERGMLSWITGSGVLREEILDRDAAALEAYYGNRGFLNAKVGQPEVTYSETGITVTFQVDEGARYKVTSVEYAGEMIGAPQDLNSVVKMDDLVAKKEYLDRSVMRSDLQKLTEHYSNFGYAFAEADVKIDRNDAENTVALTYTMSKGAKVSINRVLIEGNTKTRDNVIRREMRLADGDLFSGSQLRRSNARLNKLDFFETVEITPEPAGSPNELNLRVKVKEKPTGQFSAGVGYSSYAQVFFSGQILERNLFGMGYQLGFTGTISAKSADYTATFWNPHYNDTNLGMGVSLYNKLNDYSDYDKQAMGGRLLFGYPLGEYTNLNWHYRLEQYTIEDVEDDADKVIKDIEGENWASSFYASIKRDTTDRRINPTKGMTHQFSTEYGGGILGGDDDFIKYIADANHYFPIFLETVIHLHAQAGYIMENGGDRIPPFERFYLGGMNSVRGYKERSVSPLYDDKDASEGYEEGDEKGGNKSFFFNAEYLVPLHKEMGILGLVFFDAGKAWDEDENIDTDLYKSVGAGVRWYSPLGPLRLEYGYPLDEINNEREGRFEFSVGQFF
ncbi:outer membrane protein assembly factor BamA [Desulfomicrobium escambiense]|uniref:outer membrane protein assembly factor BamA n=1 Tax=Desulfomicrobium escambiense TaxID=29503 RepID=UPI00042A49C7|nr:outer membrane protein assembly factor BamA [Desulfomicrobium escambiense]